VKTETMLRHALITSIASIIISVAAIVITFLR
jgi:hypothetical protein